MFGYINRNLEILFLSYFTIFLHEIAHLLASILIGLVPSHIALFPFGTNLKLKNTLIFSLFDEIILYMSGPFFNGFLSIILLFFKEDSDIWRMLYYNNVALFFFNILPILPMDGGIVIKKILTYKIGSRHAEILLKIVSCICILFLIGIEVMLLIKSNFNFSILVAVIFLTGNIFTNKEKHYTELAKELLFYKEKDKKSIKKVKGYLIKKDANIKKLIRNFSVGNSYVIFKEDEKGNICEIVTERTIIEEMLK